MVVPHVLVKIIQILLAPVTTILRPAFWPGLNPGVHTGKGSGILRGWLVFIDQDRNRLPGLAVLDHAIPVDVALFWKDEDHRMTVVGQIGATMRSFGTDVGFVGLIEGGDGAVGSLSILVGRFIVEKCHFEAGLIRSLLKECKIAIGERSTLAIPIDNKSGDAHVACLLDLLAQ